MCKCQDEKLEWDNIERLHWQVNIYASLLKIYTDIKIFMKISF